MTKCTCLAKKVMFWLTEREIELIADALQLTLDETGKNPMRDELMVLIKKLRSTSHKRNKNSGDAE